MVSIIRDPAGTGGNEGENAKTLFILIAQSGTYEGREGELLPELCIYK